MNLQQNVACGLKNLHWPSLSLMWEALCHLNNQGVRRMSCDFETEVDKVEVL